MEAVAIRNVEGNRTSCVFCGREMSTAPGPHLFDHERQGILCRNCGVRQAPALIALIDLARTAQRVGRVCRHTLVPPMESLLELARAAENYNDSEQLAPTLTSHG